MMLPSFEELWHSPRWQAPELVLIPLLLLLFLLVTDASNDDSLAGPPPVVVDTTAKTSQGLSSFARRAFRFGARPFGELARGARGVGETIQHAGTNIARAPRAAFDYLHETVLLGRRRRQMNALDSEFNRRGDEATRLQNANQVLEAAMENMRREHAATIERLNDDCTEKVARAQVARADHVKFLENKGWHILRQDGVPHVLKKQKEQLEGENATLQEQVTVLQNQVAALIRGGAQPPCHHQPMSMANSGSGQGGFNSTAGPAQYQGDTGSRKLRVEQELEAAQQLIEELRAREEARTQELADQRGEVDMTLARDLEARSAAILPSPTTPASSVTTICGPPAETRSVDTAVKLSPELQNIVACFVSGFRNGRASSMTETRNGASHQPQLGFSPITVVIDNASSSTTGVSTRLGPQAGMIPSPYPHYYYDASGGLHGPLFPPNASPERRRVLEEQYRQKLEDEDLYTVEPGKKGHKASMLLLAQQILLDQQAEEAEMSGTQVEGVGETGGAASESSELSPPAAVDQPSVVQAGEAQPMADVGETAAALSSEGGLSSPSPVQHSGFLQGGAAPTMTGVSETAAAKGIEVVKQDDGVKEDAGMGNGASVDECGWIGAGADHESAQPVAPASESPNTLVPNPTVESDIDESTTVDDEGSALQPGATNTSGQNDESHPAMEVGAEAPHQDNEDDLAKTDIPGSSLAPCKPTTPSMVSLGSGQEFPFTFGSAQSTLPATGLSFATPATVHHPTAVPEIVRPASPPLGPAHIQTVLPVSNEASAPVPSSSGAGVSSLPSTQLSGVRESVAAPSTHGVSETATASHDEVELAAREHEEECRDGVLKEDASVDENDRSEAGSHDQDGLYESGSDDEDDGDGGPDGSGEAIITQQSLRPSSLASEPAVMLPVAPPIVEGDEGTADEVMGSALQPYCTNVSSEMGSDAEETQQHEQDRPAKIDEPGSTPALHNSTPPSSSLEFGPNFTFEFGQSLSTVPTTGLVFGTPASDQHPDDNSERPHTVPARPKTTRKTKVDKRVPRPTGRRLVHAEDHEKIARIDARLAAARATSMRKGVTTSESRNADSSDIAFTPVETRHNDTETTVDEFNGSQPVKESDQGVTPVTAYQHEDEDGTNAQDGHVLGTHPATPAVDGEAYNASHLPTVAMGHEGMDVDEFQAEVEPADQDQPEQSIPALDEAMDFVDAQPEFGTAVQPESQPGQHQEVAEPDYDSFNDFINEDAYEYPQAPPPVQYPYDGMDGVDDWAQQASDRYEGGLDAFLNETGIDFAFDSFEGPPSWQQPQDSHPQPANQAYVEDDEMLDAMDTNPQQENVQSELLTEAHLGNGRPSQTYGTDTMQFDQQAPPMVDGNEDQDHDMDVDTVDPPAWEPQEPPQVEQGHEILIDTDAPSDEVPSQDQTHGPHNPGSHDQPHGRQQPQPGLTPEQDRVVKNLWALSGQQPPTEQQTPDEAGQRPERQPEQKPCPSNGQLPGLGLDLDPALVDKIVEENRAEALAARTSEHKIKSGQSNLASKDDEELETTGSRGAYSPAQPSPPPAQQQALPVTQHGRLMATARGAARGAARTGMTRTRHAPPTAPPSVPQAPPPVPVDAEVEERLAKIAKMRRDLNDLQDQSFEFGASGWEIDEENELAENLFAAKMDFQEDFPDYDWPW